MDSLHFVKRSVSHDGLSHSHSSRARAASDITATRNIGAARLALDENQTPPALPKGFEGMLKTTTETGDIGLFSIRPSRLPTLLNTPRRTGGTWSHNGLPKAQQQQFQPFGGTNIVDDRRRLPSYARDASSEVISMYESESQKSTKTPAFNTEQDYRSFSMTQTSSYTLSNNKSYSSLRSQVADGGLQRPRSPFAYPTRLRRPGFRPSSPALTDGGSVDYSRRAEIDRNPLYTSSINTSSPASLYARKRVPAPLSIRTDTNRSTPSLLGQTSPPRRSSSPLQRAVTPGSDWVRRNDPTSGNSSPARSSYSITSTANQYQYAPVPSNATTPGKAPASPLYYDYTEEFDGEEHNDVRYMEPPPAFRVEKTIPEDRPLSAEVPAVANTPAARETEVEASLGLTPSPASLMFRAQGSTPTSFKSATSQIGREIGQPPTVEADITSPDTNKTEKLQSENMVEHPRLNATPQLDAVDAHESRDLSIPADLVARKLSVQANEAFGLPQSSSPTDEARQVEATSRGSSKSDIIQSDSDTEPVFPTRSSSYILNNPLPIFPTPPGHRFSEHIVYADFESEKGVIIDERLIPLHAEAPKIARKPVRTPSSATQERKSTPCEIACEDKNSMSCSETPKTLIETPRRTPMISPTIPEEKILDRPLMCTVAPASPELTLDGSHNGGRRTEAATAPLALEKGYLNFSHQIPRRTVSRSDSPMLAPKPISPARQLKLKNSVPQLMKALPPLPPDLSVRVAASAKMLGASHNQSTSQYPTLVPDAITQQQMHIPKQEGFAQHYLPSVNEKYNEKELQKGQLPVELHSDSILAVSSEKTTSEPATAAKLATPPPKLKLRMRSSSTLRPTSPPDARPWNLEESYPWTTHQPNVRLPSLISNSPHRSSRQPKFRLKVTRASNSTQGTVRITRDSSDYDGLANGLDFQNPKDLFTPSTTGLDTIFRKVSKNLKVRRSSVTSTRSAEERILPMVSERAESRTRRPPDLNLTVSNEALKATSTSLAPPFSPTDVRSFFSDDSSHQGSSSLRKRISNLRNRMVVPYGSRNASQSFDDILFRERLAAEHPVVNSNLNTNRTGNERDGRYAKREQAKKLKARVSEWFKGARLAIKAKVKSRSQMSKGSLAKPTGEV